jgi:hypothetical protein
MVKLTGGFLMIPRPIIMTPKVTYENLPCWEWWYTPVVPALGRLKQEDGEFKASLGYVVKP